jgi:hypothetical protein
MTARTRRTPAKATEATAEESTPATATGPTEAAEVTAPDQEAAADAAEARPAEPKGDTDSDGKGEDSDDADESGTRYLNVTSGSVLYSKAGNLVGPGEWTPPVHLDALGQAARSNGHLLPPSAL